MRVRGHDADVFQRETGTGHQVEMDVHDDLTLDVQLDVVDQAVDGGAHRALDGVLDRHEPEVRLPAGDGLEDVGDGTQRPQLGPGQIGLREEGLVREGGFRAEVGDAGRRGVHSWAG